MDLIGIFNLSQRLLTTPEKVEMLSVSTIVLGAQGMCDTPGERVQAVPAMLETTALCLSESGSLYSSIREWSSSVLESTNLPSLGPGTVLLPLIACSWKMKMDEGLNNSWTRSTEISK